jgi:hypothetical protein
MTSTVHAAGAVASFVTEMTNPVTNLLYSSWHVQGIVREGLQEQAVYEGWSTLALQQNSRRVLAASLPLNIHCIPFKSRTKSEAML